MWGINPDHQTRNNPNPPPLRKPRRSGHPEIQRRVKGCATRPANSKSKAGPPVHPLRAQAEEKPNPPTLRKTSKDRSPGSSNPLQWLCHPPGGVQIGIDVVYSIHPVRRNPEMSAIVLVRSSGVYKPLERRRNDDEGPPVCSHRVGRAAARVFVQSREIRCRCIT